MTPAERDEVRRIAATICAGMDPVGVGSPLATSQLHAMLTLATFAMRYVPPGDAKLLGIEPRGTSLFVPQLRDQWLYVPGALALAHALYAAADAAEES